MLRVFIFAVLLGAFISAQEYRERNLFQDGLRGLMSASAGIQRRLGELSAGVSGDIGLLRKDIESQIDDRLPPYLRGLARSTTNQNEPVEAIIGGLGDDESTLEVLMPGEKDPEAIRSETYQEFLDGIETDAEVISPSELSPQTPVVDKDPKRQLFNFKFDFGSPIDTIFSRTPFFNRRNSPTPWWQGENVCVKENEVSEEEETTEEKKGGENETKRSGTKITYVGDLSLNFFDFQTKSCSEKNEVYSCVTTIRRRGINKSITKEYRCCHGYSKSISGYCDKVVLQSMSATLKDLEHDQLLSSAASHGVTADMLDRSNITIFAPSNQAFEDYISDMQETNDIDFTKNEVFRRKRSHNNIDLDSVIKTHLVEGIHYPSTLKDEQILNSKWSDGSVRVNIYNSEFPPMTTINCAKVVGDPIPTEKGIVYEIDRVAKPSAKSLADIIANDPQFTILRSLMESSEVMETLKDPKSQLTLLAPTDAAFNALPEEKMKAIKASSCQDAILKNHLLPNVICSAAVVSPKMKTINLLENYLKVRLNENGNIQIGGSTLVGKDVVAKNGVMHIIDTPLIPSQAQSVISVLKGLNLTEFIELSSAAGLLEDLEKLTDATIFVPSNRAIREQVHRLDAFKANPEALKSVLMSHITNSPLTRRSLRNNAILPTKGSQPLRVNMYTGPLVFSLFSPVSHRSRITAGCARVTLTDVRACGAQIHVVDDLLEQNEGHVLDELERWEHFSIFRDMVKNSGLAEEYARHNSTLTVLAPSDHVFKTLPEKELEQLLNDKSFQEQLVQRHTLREHICCSGIAPSGLFANEARTSAGNVVPFRQTHEGLYKVGSARITKCSKPSSNGLVHTVDRLMFEPHVVDSPISRRWDREGTLPIKTIDLRKLFQF